MAKRLASTRSKQSGGEGRSPRSRRQDSRGDVARLVDSGVRTDQEMPRGHMTGAVPGKGAMPGSRTMPAAAGEMPGMPGTTGDGLATSEMPRGEMTATPGGTTRVSADGLATSEMPTGAMTTADVTGVSGREMPSGEMTTVTMASETQSGGMPRGRMSAPEGLANVGTIELPGQWRLILSPASGRTR